MRLSLSVNGGDPVVASLSGPGYLSAHLNMSDRPKDSDHSKMVRIAGSETRERETVRLSWPTVELKTGDVVKVQILADGEGDAPSEIRKSSESPHNLFSNVEVAKELLKVVSEFEERLNRLVHRSEGMEPADEHKKFVAAWGTVLWELGVNFLYPVYRRHTELIPDGFKGELL